MDNQNVQIQTIENAKRKDVLPGDHLIWTRTRHDGMITVTQQREGIAYHQDANGDWKNKEGAWITSGESQLTIHRTLQTTLPTKAMTAIIPADGHERIQAVVEGKSTEHVKPSLTTMDNGKQHGESLKLSSRQIRNWTYLINCTHQSTQKTSSTVHVK